MRGPIRGPVWEILKFKDVQPLLGEDLLQVLYEKLEKVKKGYPLKLQLGSTNIRVHYRWYIDGVVGKRLQIPGDWIIFIVLKENENTGQKVECTRDHHEVVNLLKFWIDVERYVIKKEDDNNQ
ncbi:hypothetical protein [Thermoflavimicrobium daqui]|jgi:hypothetical protein|uniref:Uncharacterized protein n=1 Tax=Thermoflavimicrobium daqui TaxID=2137476 RepID=A0A364K6G2_9BACL|nr:hypothetical protein [Thermoflavimicrobium daqui]RAL25884.1 hypothetical protein DL897_07345 [Thermoflavimicrobium daqui]